MNSPLFLLLLPFIIFFFAGIETVLVEIYFYLFRREVFSKEKLKKGLTFAFFGVFLLFIHETKLDKKHS